LSLERPPFYGIDHPEMQSDLELDRAQITNWNERRSLLSSLVTGVRMLLARGIIDPARIGLTGLSDGASATRFALVNTRIFAAAAISSCCTDTNAMMNAGGIGFADAERNVGYPPTIDHDEAFWAPYSMSLSAKRMDRPLLMQLADSEMNLSLETFMALREAGQPVEMYVFPDERHVKWQPAHRRAIYERNLDWFDFWLRGRKDPDPAKAEQYRRWDAMRLARKGGSSG
jgi:dipeptidyl aminopeptidase/acylaminoacyl peptidase